MSRRQEVLLAVVAALSVLLGAPAGAAPTTAGSGNAVNQFPEGFLFGASSAAYQIEGGWNADGKGESIWDRLLHTFPNLTTDGRNGDVAADSYHKYKEDVEALASIGANFYRFSISWPRILPTGDTNVINQAGIDYYNNLINALLEKGIQPLVTIYHWDLPFELQKLGGWTNPRIAEYYVQYAKVLFENFGDRVKLWITINEPDMFTKGYATWGQQAPSVNASGIGDYQAGHTVLLAHAGAWHLYDEHFRPTQKGKIGITLNIDWSEPATDSADDAEAAERSLQFTGGLFAHPIFSSEGDYPSVVRLRVDANSKAEGRGVSRLPSFTTSEVEYIRGTSDFFGLNHYTSWYVADGVEGTVPSKTYDSGTITTPMTEYPLTYSAWLRVIPSGIRKIVNWVSKTYPGHPILITENGCSDDGSTLDDQQRIEYYTGYLSEVVKAINVDGVDVIGYSAWSIIDNLEWMAGYTNHFGVFRVDYDDPDRPRTAKASASVLKKIYESNSVPLEYFTPDSSST
ncbi:myrosinase 1-like [Schistocerca americana]|uniref:myrosinase 1-like n=1 Tax=Schistocerca americana TaxID=7009 RepID=UPI001F4FC7E5|nr:myrosinase 1-like [Schistocerca americana]